MRYFLSLLITLCLVNPCWGGVDLSGDGDSIECGDITTYDGATSLSVAAWVNIDSLTANNKVIAKWDETGSDKSFVFQVGSSGRLLGAVNDSASDITVHQSASGSGAVVVDTWTHVIFTWSSSNNWTFYIDGVDAGDSTVYDSGGTVDSVKNTTQNMRIGKALNGGADLEPMNGTFGQVSLYKNKVISQSEATLLANSKVRLIPCQIGATDYWKLDDNPDGTGISGDTYVSICGSGNDGTGADGDSDSLNSAEEVLSYPPQ